MALMSTRPKWAAFSSPLA